jgi:lysophospholipase L1-like esterase
VAELRHGPEAMTAAPVRRRSLASRALLVAVLAALTVTGINAPTAPAEAATRPTVAIVGDSFSTGWGAKVCRLPPTPDGAWWRYTTAQLGWTVNAVNATGGAGFVQKGAGGRTLGDALRAHPLPRTTDYVILQGGLNDRFRAPADVTAGVRRTLATIRAQAPRARILVVSAFRPAGAVSANYVRVARAIAAPQAVGSTPHVSAVRHSFGTCDGIHPDAAGHRAIGAWVAARFARGFDNAAPLRKHPSGAFYGT